MDKKRIKNILTYRGEGTNVDYKVAFNWTTATRKARLDLIKDILSMANSNGGGQIVFGVRDKDFEILGLSDEDISSFDQTRVNNLLHEFSDPEHNAEIFKFKVQERRLVIINVPEFSNEPVICKKDGNSDKGICLLRRGALYMRTGKGTSEEIRSNTQMRDLIRRASKKYVFLLKEVFETMTSSLENENGKEEKLNNDHVNIILDEKSTASSVEKLSKLLKDAPKGTTCVYISVAGQRIRTPFMVGVSFSLVERIKNIYGVRQVDLE